MEFLITVLMPYKNLILLLVLVTALIICLICVVLWKRKPLKTILIASAIIAVLTAGGLIAGFYDARVRPQYRESEISETDASALCESIMKNHFDYEDFLPNRKNDFVKPVESGERYPSSGEGLKKVSMKSVTYKTASSMGFFKFEYQTEQDAANEYQREKQQWGDAPIRVVETAQYRILIAPRSHETRFLDFETGDRCSYSEGLILQYQNFVVRIGEDTWCKKMMLPDFIQKNRLFDKDYV